MTVRKLACAMLVAFVSLTALASAQTYTRSPSYKFPRTDGARAYQKAHHQVAHLLGHRAAGRDIVRYGIRFKWVSKDHSQKHWGIRRATWTEVRQRTASLRHKLLYRPSGDAWLAKVRACESGGNYATNTGNGFYGAYQFTKSSWAAAGGSGNPAAASPAEQDMRALRLRAIQGTGAWPVCG